VALPTFFIIGAGKAGTTSLNYYLGLHPQIQMSAIKEPNFFAGAENGNPYPKGRVSCIDEYERLFDPTVAMRGEASPAYTSHPIRRGAPENIKELVPEAKFIYLVRDPIARTVSHYQHLVATGAERRSLREVLSNLSDPFSLPETCYSLYASQIEQYLRHFSQERLLVIDQSEFLAQRGATLREVFRFLSVDDDFVTPQFEEELYKSSERRVYPSGYERFVGLVLAPAIRWIPRRVRRTARRSVEGVLFPALQAPALDDELRGRLAELYADEVERLRQLTGNAFATWSV
jgi:hypothetical protein